MNTVHKFAIAVGLAVVLKAGAASATPYVNIRANWSVFTRAAPEGVSIACAGSATGGASGCEGGVALNTSVNSSQVFNVSLTGDVVVTNTTDHALTGYVDFVTNFSAFNPGGPGIGVSID